MANAGIIGELIYEELREFAIEPASLSVLETLGHQIARKAMRKALGKWFQELEESVPEPTTKCRNCGKDANYVTKRPGVKQTSFGSIRYLRAYYVCPNCFQHTCPLDERLDPYASLARMRIRICNGEEVHVGELAQSWGLGSLSRIHSLQAENVSEVSTYSVMFKEGIYPYA